MGNCWIRVRWAIGGFACWTALAQCAMAQYSSTGSNAPVVENYASALSATDAQTTAAMQSSLATPTLPPAPSALQPIPAGQNIPGGQNCQQCPGPAQEFPPGCCTYGPQKWPDPCCPPTLNTDTTKDFGYYLKLPPPGVIYAVADGIALQRLPRGPEVDFAVNGAGTTVLSTNDFNYDYQGGGRILVGATLGNCFQVEGLYWRIATAEDTEAIRDYTTSPVGTQGDLYSPFGGFGVSPVVGVDYMNFAQIRYTSSLQDFEMNLRRVIPMPEGRLTCSVLIGVRYMGLPEEFDFNTETAYPSPGAINVFHINTDNQMVGPQVGGLMEFYVDNRWWFNFEFKGAVMDDSTRLTTWYENTNSAGVFSSFANSVHENHTVFAEDLSLTCVYHWNEHITTRFGWQAVFMQNLALAAENLGTDIYTLRSGPAVLNHNGSIVYQGPVAGITLAW